MNSIKIINVTKDYGNNRGNFNINLDVNESEAYAILGPNGAGKTTLVSQVMGFIKPTSGQIKINEIDSLIEPEKIMEFVGYIPGDFLLYKNIKGKDYFDIISSFRKNIDKKYLDYLIQYFELDPNIKIKKMSKGTKQKVAIINALMFKPKILVLDEPTSGLDPLMMEKFNNIIMNLKKQGCTIFVCSHIFQEVAKFCDKAAFLKNGKIIKEINIKNNNVDLIEKEFLNIFKEKMEFNYE
ncbi:ABC transporter ATP-binding protein [Spiroplasma endosymbiont of Crioceris asparagi]|uniref:ABC transporter ATP-binding protein n=1 Tax=Spiroplasma endosymbiont of Crioceris asparagi TaxID=3066286 RepID=UPI0030CBFEDB